MRGFLSYGIGQKDGHRARSRFLGAVTFTSFRRGSLRAGPFCQIHIINVLCRLPALGIRSQSGYTFLLNEPKFRVQRFVLPLFFGLCAATNCQSQTLPIGQHLPARDTLDSGGSSKRLSDLVDAFSRVEAALERRWPGFWTSTCGVVVADTDGVAVLFTPRVFGRGSRGECGKTSWIGVPASLLPSRLVGRVFMSRDPAMGGTNSLLRTRYNAGGTSVVAVRSAAPAAKAMEFAIHETFHGFQEKHFTSLIGVSDIVSDSIMNDSSFRTSVEIEREMLRTILGIRSQRAIRQLAKGYLEHRRVRLSLVDKRVGEVERLLERKEGTA